MLRKMAHFFLFILLFSGPILSGLMGASQAGNKSNEIDKNALKKASGIKSGSGYQAQRTCQG